MDIDVYCSIQKKSGAAIRAQEIVNNLKKNGCNIFFPDPPSKSLFHLEQITTCFAYSLIAKKRTSDIAIALKPLPQGCIPALIEKKNGAKAVVDIDDLEWAYYSWPLSTVFKWFEKKIVPKFDLVMAQNEMLAKEFANIAEDVFISPEGVDVDLFNPKKHNMENLRKEFGFEKKKIVFYTGHLGVASNLEEILQAFKKVSKELKDSILLIVGDGPLKNYYENFARKIGIGKNVVMTGYVSNEDVRKYMCAADMCVVYYRKNKVNLYRNSMKLRQYLSMGKVVVCNDFGDLSFFRDVTVQSETGDINNFAKKIVSVLNGNVDASLGINGRRFVVKNCSWTSITKRMVRRFKELSSN